MLHTLLSVLHTFQQIRVFFCKRDMQILVHFFVVFQNTVM